MAPTAFDERLAAQCRSLRATPTALLADVLQAMGLPDQVLACALRPVGDALPFAGPAVCFAGDEAAHDTQGLVYEADRRIRPGTVAVVATAGHRVGAVLGGNTLAGWRLRGCVALITDGLIRDTEAFAGFPAYAGGVTPLNNRGRWAYRALDVATRLPGQSVEWVAVAPRDVVVGDRDGLVVVPAPHVALAVEYAGTALAVEQRMRARILSGEDREAVYRSSDRFGHIRCVAPIEN